MMNNFEVVENNNCVPLKPKNIGVLKNGISNSALFFLIGFVLHLITDNYLSYGIIKGPLEIIFNFFDLLTESWWLCTIILIGFPLQISLCFVIEKLLALKILTETIGKSLHIFNAFLLVLTHTAISYIYKLNPVALHVIGGHIGVQFFKIISYIYVNQSYRENSTEVPNTNGKQIDENHDTNSKLIRYPNNVTVSNAIDYFVCSGSFIYNLEEIPRVPKNWKKAFQTICTGVLIYYVCGLLTFQYVIPEMKNAKTFINNFQILNLLSVFFKLWFPVNVVWLLHYQFWCFSSVLPLYGWIWGTKEYIYFMDWWNAENMTIFWQKWNYQTHVSLKTYLFTPLKRRGYSKMQSAFIVSFLSGLLHEYLVSIPCRSSYGFPTAAMLIQIPLAVATTYIHKNLGPEFGNFAMIWSLLSGNTLSLVTIYYNYS